jgi:NAD(P)-dependent dehydrogenase (short-subunit alcohol dehydrogenase family)
MVAWVWFVEYRTRQNETMNTMTGKTVLVTGATNGIGFITARELAKMDATVLMVARDETKGRAKLEEIRKVVPHAKLELLLADLSSMASIRQLATNVITKYSSLDVLVNNAGAFYSERRVSKDGLELTFALNHIGYFLLTNLLLDTLKRSKNARIVSVSSGAHFGAKINFDDLQLEQKFSGWNAYCTSKLMNVLFTKELSRKLEGTGVTANCLHPGFVNTGFAGEAKDFIGRALNFVKNFAAITPEKGAETMIYLSSSQDVANMTGEYFEKEKIAKVNPIALDSSIAKRLWDVSEKLTAG